MPSTYFVTDAVDTPSQAASHIISVQEYIRGNVPLPLGAKLLVSCKDQTYLSLAYHAALLAEARGHSALPPVDNMVALRNFSQATPARLRNVANPVLGVLRTPTQPHGPSDTESLRDFISCSEALGMEVKIIDKDQISNFENMDALFIRDLTSPANYTYEISVQATSQGIPVIDDPSSIIRCSNKIFINDLCERTNIPAPRALVLTPEMSIEDAVVMLGLPIVLKIPDGSFSRGVSRAHTLPGAEEVLAKMRLHSPIVLAQEYMPTDFDWRVGVLNGKALFVCKYYMVPGHWQILQHLTSTDFAEGTGYSVPVARAPKQLIELAERAACRIGNGLYGIDIKEFDGSYYVIEINDNPDIHSDLEAGIKEERVWSRIATYFVNRIASVQLATQVARGRQSVA